MARKVVKECLFEPSNLQAVEQAVDDGEWNSVNEYIRHAVRNQLQAGEGGQE